MKAVIVTGGKQYTVAEGDVVFVEKLGAEAEATVKFDQVLAVLDGENTKIGAPTVEGASVEAKVVKNGKGKKLDIIRYKSKKNEKPGFFARIKKYFASVKSEMKRVTWPDKKELVNYSVVVCASLIVVGVVIALLDAGFGEALALFSGLRG